MLKRLLWVDPNIADSQCLERLRQCQYVAICAETGAEAIRALKRTTYDLVVLGPRLDVETASLVAEIRRISEFIPIALHSPDVPAAGLALDGRFLGVRSVNEIQPRALDRILTSHTQASEPWMNLMVGNSPAMQKVIQLVRLVGPRKATVLITGETGTGKELAARAIHMASGRGALPMVSVNCAALPASLLEAELFGHARGAFTGALTQRIGRFEQAHRGTIFLDEIGEIPLELQAKLLRVLQEREIQRVGSSETIRLDFRVIAASNIDLEEAVRKQRFRQDLLYRLNVAPLHMPRLRDRISDIPVLVDHFLDRICRQEGLPVKQSSREAVEHLSSYHWPGNVRQLEHKVEKAIAFSGERRQLYPVDFPLPEEAKACPAIPETMLDVPETGIDFDQMISGIERAVLGQALAKSGGNKARAASLLGMKRTTLLSKVKALSLEAS